MKRFCTIVGIVLFLILTAIGTMICFADSIYGEPSGILDDTRTIVFVEALSGVVMMAVVLYLVFKRPSGDRSAAEDPSERAETESSGYYDAGYEMYYRDPESKRSSSEFWK